MTAEKYEFPFCMHPIEAALHMLDINPEGMVIELPFDDWWKLRCRMESKFACRAFDGRGVLPDTFALMGVQFRARRLAAHPVLGCSVGYEK